MKETTANQDGYQRWFEIVQDSYQEIREMVQLQMRGAALKLIKGLFQEEMEELCGKPFSRKKEQHCHRGGSDKGSVVLQGQRVGVDRPRAKNAGQEVQIKTYEALQGYDLLCDRVMKHMLAGVSSRNYDGLLEELEGGLGVKKSLVSKAFVKGSRRALEEINGKDLSGQEWIAIMIDGIGLGKRMVVAALGITTAGKKQILGLREGDTENSEVCKDLLSNLVERGLSSQEIFLFVLDGSKALKKAVKKVFGERFPIQRCVRHKERNVLEYLPRNCHGEFRRRWKMIHGSINYQRAQQQYDQLRCWLSRINQAALESLEEAEMETLTVIRLKTPGLLRKTLLSTNPLESVFSGVRSQTGRVKNWRTGSDQASRWAAATLVDTQKKFRLIRGYREIPALMSELKNLGLHMQAQVA